MIWPLIANRPDSYTILIVSFIARKIYIVQSDDEAM